MLRFPLSHWACYKLNAQVKLTSPCQEPPPVFFSWMENLEIGVLTLAPLFNDSRNAICDMIRVSWTSPCYERNSLCRFPVSEKHRDQGVDIERSFMQKPLLCKLKQTGNIVTMPLPNNPLQVQRLWTHMCSDCFSFAFLINCVRTPTSASGHDSAAHDQIAVWF